MNTFNISYYFSNNYFEIFILIVVSVLISNLLILLSYIIIYQKPDSEKLSMYECGFDPYENSRNQFNINFYLIAIFFLIFDLEILYILPWSINLSNTSLLGTWGVIDFILELGIAYFYLYYNNCLIWK